LVKISDLNILNRKGWVSSGNHGNIVILVTESDIIISKMDKYWKKICFLNIIHRDEYK
jgi:hypothetical protein